MKQTARTFNKPLFSAILFFGLMATVGIAAAHAQDTNILISTTGPNVLGQGHIQWNSSLEYYHYGYNGANLHFNSHSFGIATGLRFGIGSRAELTLDLAGAYNTFDTANFHNTTGITPAVGAKLLLFDGRGLLPRTSFFTNVAAPVGQNAYNDKWYSLVQPEIGLQFRNRLGKWFLLDYSLGYAWNRYSVAEIDITNQVQYSLHLHWMHSDRQMSSIGISNRNSIHCHTVDLETRRLLTDDLQLTVAASYAAGYGLGVGYADRIHGLVGISWMIK